MYKTIIGDKKIREAQSELGKKTWPEFMQHDSVVEKYWSLLYTDFLEFQFALYSDENFIGVGNSVPLYLEKGLKRLPDNGLDWAITKAVDDSQNKLTPNLLVGVQILIDPGLQSKGLSYQFLAKMKEVAEIQGFNHIALPVRPNLKHLYPLIPMEKYIRWTNQDGEPFDPWIRVHIKSGGKIVSICKKSMMITGEIKEWEEWTGLRFHSSGRYTVDKALCPITIDVDKNLGEYLEPNVWIVHPGN